MRNKPFPQATENFTKKKPPYPTGIKHDTFTQAIGNFGGSKEHLEHIVKKKRKKKRTSGEDVRKAFKELKVP